jgi:outer membrane protein assembly factor BamB
MWKARQSIVPATVAEVVMTTVDPGASQRSMAAGSAAQSRMLTSAARALRSILVLAGICASAACSRDGVLDPADETVDPADTVVTTVRLGIPSGPSLNGSLLTVLGSTGLAIASARNSSGSVVLDKRFQFKTDVPGVVSLGEYAAGLPSFVAITALADGSVEVTASVDGIEGKVAIEVDERARVVWSVPTLGAFRGVAIAEDGTLYIAATEGLQAVGPQGDLRWVLSKPAMSMPAIGEDRTIYLASRDSVIALGPDGTVRWVTPIERASSSPAIGPDGTIYLVASDGTLYAVAPNGQIEWRFAAPGSLPTNRSPPAIAQDGTIYFGSQDRHLYAIDSDGREKWRFRTGGEVRSPSIGADGTVYFANDRIVQLGATEITILADSKLYALNPDGTERWSVVLEGDVWAGPAIGFDGKLHMGSEEWIYAFDPGGSLLRKYAPETIHTPVVAGDGTVYLGLGRLVYALDSAGKLSWEYGSPQSSLGAAAPAIGLDGTIYAGSRYGSAYQLIAFTELGGTNGGYANAPWPTERGDRANTGRVRGR